MRADQTRSQDNEEFFWNEEARRCKYIDKFIGRDIAEIIEKDILLKKLTLSLTGTRGKEILDCGCGTGNLSAYLAMKDAYVKSFDISSEMVKVAYVNAEKNGISGRCNFLCCGFDDLPYRDVSFDLVVGAYILHHVDVERVVRELHRALKPGGRAVFTETWRKNPLLVWAGKYLAGRFGIAKYGTKYEHPITTVDIKKMRKVFPEIYLEFPEFIFLKKQQRMYFDGRKIQSLLPVS